MRTRTASVLHTRRMVATTWPGPLCGVPEPLQSPAKPCSNGLVFSRLLHHIVASGEQSSRCPLPLRKLPSLRGEASLSPSLVSHASHTVFKLNETPTEGADEHEEFSAAVAETVNDKGPLGLVAKVACSGCEWLASGLRSSGEQRYCVISMPLADEPHWPGSLSKF